LHKNGFRDAYEGGIIVRRWFKKIKRRIYREGINLSYKVSLQERLGREAFFYHAFKALQYSKCDGDYAEFGCHGCMTFPMAYHHAKGHGFNMNMWAFDSFAGMPGSHDEKDQPDLWPEGSLAMSETEFRDRCEWDNIPLDKVRVVSGYFDRTLTQAGELPDDIALAYVDCDLYSSTKTVLEFLRPRLRHGMIIAFDDYFCWSTNQQPGEYMACLEFMDTNPEFIFVEFMRYAWAGNSFVVYKK
jgi:O-methyltransferase